MSVHVSIYIAMAASDTDGPGGWVAVLEDKSGRQKELSGSMPKSSDDTLLLTAFKQGLAALKIPCEIALLSSPASALVTLSRRPMFQAMLQKHRITTIKEVATVHETAVFTQALGLARWEKDQRMPPNEDLTELIFKCPCGNAHSFAWYEDPTSSTGSCPVCGGANWWVENRKGERMPF